MEMISGVAASLWSWSVITFWRRSILVALYMRSDKFPIGLCVTPTGRGLHMTGRGLGQP